MPDPIFTRPPSIDKPLTELTAEDEEVLNVWVAALLGRVTTTPPQAGTSQSGIATSGPLAATPVASPPTTSGGAT